MATKVRNLMSDFVKDEQGLALTEYLILLGLLTAGVIISVLAIGEDLAFAWKGWETWFEAQKTKLDGPS